MLKIFLIIILSLYVIGLIARFPFESLAIIFLFIFLKWIYHLNRHYLHIIFNVPEKIAKKSFLSPPSVTINADNFMSLEHFARKDFFSDKYLNKHYASFGQMRKLNTITPVFITYTNADDFKSERRVDIFSILTSQGSAYIIGFCHHAGEARTFMIDRIQSLVDKQYTYYDRDDINQFVKEYLLPDLINPRNEKIILNCLDNTYIQK
jgi:hypothetical protein